MMIDLLIFSIMSIITFFVYALDKHNATVGRWRIPEVVLLILAFLDGAFGALCAMILCHHKTQKTVFLVLVPLALVIILAVEVICRRCGVFY